MADTAPDIPADLELVRSFINTRDVESGKDEIQAPDALQRWLAARGLLDDGAVVTPDALLRALELREGLRGLLLLNAGSDQGSGAVETVNRIAAGLPLTVRLVETGDGGEARLEPRAAGGDGALARILGIVFASMAEGTWPRLKVCPKGDCLWAFYDRSKNRSRTWCAMGVCGNRVKAQRFRQRHKEPQA